MTFKTVIFFTLLVSQYGCHQIGTVLLGDELYANKSLPIAKQDDAQKSSTDDPTDVATDDSLRVPPKAIRLRISDNANAQSSFANVADSAIQEPSENEQFAQQAAYQFDEMERQSPPSQSVQQSQFVEYFPTGPLHQAPQQTYPHRNYPAPGQTHATLRSNETNQPTQRTATERVVELADENVRLRGTLEARDAEIKALRSELTQARQTIISANQVVNTTVEKIQQVSEKLAERNRQIEQMHHLIREHESNTAARLQRLTGSLRRSLENETRSQKTITPIPKTTGPLVPTHEQTQPPVEQTTPEIIPPPPLEMPMAQPLLVSPSTARKNVDPTR